eukprot:534224_1
MSDYNYTIRPLSYSCSRKQCNVAYIREFNNNHCNTTIAQMNYTSFAVVTDECYNWFDSDNIMKSSKLICDSKTTSYFKYIYNDSNCKTLSNVITETNPCRNGTEHIIQCINASVLPTTTTVPPLTTFNPTVSPITYGPTIQPITPKPTYKDRKRVYVSENGLDFDGCGATKETACGTMMFASYNVTETNLEIFVDSQNTQSITHWTTTVNMNPCIPFPISTIGWYTNLNVKFDSVRVQAMHDWYPKELCENNTIGPLFPGIVFWNKVFFSSFVTNEMESNLIIDNLVIDSYAFDGGDSTEWYIVKSSSKFICNNCTFSNITIHSGHQKVNNYSALIVAAEMELYNCSFRHISYISSTEYVDDFGYDFSFIMLESNSDSMYRRWLNNFVFINTYIQDIFMLHAFVHFQVTDSPGNIINSDGSLQNISAETKIYIHNTKLSQISVVDAVFYYDTETAIHERADIVLSDTDINNLFLGSIWHTVSSWARTVISIENTFISTPQTIEGYLNTKQRINRHKDESYLGALFVFNSMADVISINTIDIHYDDAQYFAERCQPYLSIKDWLYWYQLQDPFEFYRVEYHCKIPQQFMYSRSMVNITQLRVRNDITDETTNAYKDFILTEIHSFVGDTNRTIYMDFRFDTELDSNYIDFIYNDGILNIQSFYIYGAGVHSQMIYSPGNLMIDGMITFPNTYCTSTIRGCNYDVEALHIENMISFAKDTYLNDKRFLSLTNSDIFGVSSVAFDFNAGDIYLYNVTLEMATYGIFLSSFYINLEIVSSSFKNIGSYYGSPGHVLYALDPTVQPFFLDAQSVVIKYSLFSFVDPYQFHFFGSDYYDLFDSNTDYGRAKIQLIDNVFTISDVDILYDHYPLHHSMDIFGIQNNLDLNQYFVVKGWLRIPNNVNASLINNKFLLNENNKFVHERILSEYNMANIYVTNSDGITCVDGIYFHNFAIWLKEGNITSCVKPQIIDYFDENDCESYGSFGGIDVDAIKYNNGKPNLFHVSNNLTSVIVVEDEAFLSLHHNIFNPQQSNINILDIENGNYLLLDTEIMINDSFEYDIKINQGCTIICVSLRNVYPHQMVVFHTICNDSVENNKSLSLYDFGYPLHFTDHGTPWYLDIDTGSGTRNNEYFPGGQLQLTHYIYDIEYNLISALNQEIKINLESMNEHELFLKSQAIIDTNGECHGCDIYLQSSHIGLVGNQYALKLFVLNNDLLLINNVINFTVIECPAGFGLSGNAKQCEECKIDYFNLVSTNSACLKCDKDTDGVFCYGSNQIMLQKSYWMDVYQYGTNLNDKYFISENQENTKYIISGKCPNGYCCELENGCNFISDNDSLCAMNRDVSAPLCGQCKPGYSELFGSAQCGKCNHPKLYLILYPILMGLAWSIYILFTKSTKQEPQDSSGENIESDVHNSCIAKLKKCCMGIGNTLKHCVLRVKTSICSKCTNDGSRADLKVNQQKQSISRNELMNTVETMIIINMVYYYQTLMNLISLTNGIPTSLVSFVALFNFDVFSMIPTDADDKDEKCLFKNMTAFQEIVASLSTIIVIILFTFTVCLLFNIKTCKFNVLKQCKRNPNPSRTMLKVLFLCIGQILNVLFKTLTCRDIGDNISVHFYFGSIECNGIKWWISLIILLMVVSAFIILFIFIGIARSRHLSSCIYGCECIYHLVDSNQKRYELAEKKELKEWYHSAVCYYKIWFWELIIFMRRLLLSFALIVYDSDDLRMCTIFGLVIYCMIHSTLKPFRFDDANQFELWLLISTIAVISLDNYYRTVPKNLFGNLMISLLILFPIVWIIYYMISRFKLIQQSDENELRHHHKIQQNMNNEESELEMEELEIDTRKKKSLKEILSVGTMGKSMSPSPHSFQPIHQSEDSDVP